MSLLSRLYPRGPIDVGDRLEFLQEDGYVPSAPSWRWIFTPGHSPGHVSLFRGRDRVLIAGDAVTTTRQESAIAVATQRRELHGPPAYFTQDWRGARESVGRLAALEPEILPSGHGEPMAGATCVAICARWRRDSTTSKYPRSVATPRNRLSPTNAGFVRPPPDPLPKVMVGAAVAASDRLGRCPADALAEVGTVRLKRRTVDPLLHRA